MGVRYEKEKFDEYQGVDTLVIWYLDFTGDQIQWPSVAETFCLHLDQPNFVGRAVAQDECPIPDPRISRRHAVLEVVDRNLSIKDLGSANGTFVNGRRIEGPVMLNVGDQVNFDRVSFRVRRSLNIPELSFDPEDDDQTAGLARRRLIQARRERLANESKLPQTEVADTSARKNKSKIQSRYAAYMPIMLGSGLALLVASIIIYLL